MAAQCLVPLRERVLKLQSKPMVSGVRLGVEGRPERYKQWTEMQMTSACELVRRGDMSCRRAAESFNIPPSTLNDRITGKTAMGAVGGPPRYLTDVEENELVNFLVGCSKVGYSRSRKQVIALVQRIVDAKGKQVTVTQGWWVSFRKRHPEIALRVSEPLANVCTLCTTSDVVEKYLDLLENTLKSNDLMEKPCQIFNCDESGLPLTPHPPKVVVPKGVKHPIAIGTGDRSQMTVLVCCSAGGYVIPPFVIFDRKTLKPEMVVGEVPGTMYGLSSNGWIDTELFEQWFMHHFLAYAPPTRPRENVSEH